MPQYNTQNPPPAIYPQGGPTQQSFLVFNAEAIVANEFSQQLNLAPGPVSEQKGIRVVVDFNQNPGNVELLVCESDNDKGGSADYIIVPTAGDLTQASLANGPNGASTRLVTDLIPIAGQFVAIFVKTAPSNGGTTCTVRITRAN